MGFEKRNLESFTTQSLQKDPSKIVCRQKCVFHRDEIAFSDFDLQDDPAFVGGAAADGAGGKISLDEKRSFARSLYKLTKDDLGKLIVEVDTKCPRALKKNNAEDECELNVDEIAPALFAELREFVGNCKTSGTAGSKKKAGGAKRQKT